MVIIPKLVGVGITDITTGGSVVIIPKLVGVGITDMSGRILLDGELTSDVEFGGSLESDNGMAKQGDRITRLLRSSCIGEETEGVSRIILLSLEARG